MLLEGIISQLRKGKDIEDILEKQDWKKFENVITEIFKENEFFTKQNFRFKTKKRYEIDILSVKGNKVFCIDCKWWGRRRYKKSGLKQAIILQQNRMKEFMKFLKKNTIARNILRLNTNYSVSPLLVTLHEEDIVKENDTFIIPAWKLNKFITEMENYF